MHQEIWQATKANAAMLLKKNSVPGPKQLTIGERQTKFSPETLRSILTKWVASSDHAFSELENPWLLRAFEYCNIKALDGLKTANTVKADIKANHATHLQELKDLLHRIPGKISLTTDVWTSPNSHSFMGITAHYIDPTEVKMKYQLLSFVQLLENHSGERIANAIDEVLRKFDLQWEKVNCLFN